MKKDIDQLMAAENVDVMLVTGPAFHNPSMVYLTGGGHITSADYIKKRGEPAVLFHHPMEREEAAKTGLHTESYMKYPIAKILKEANGNRIQSTAVTYQHILQDLDITSGKVAIFGQMDAGASFGIFSTLKGVMPDIDFVGYQLDGFLLKSRATKSPEEVDRIRKVGKLTTEIFDQVADFLTGHQVKDNTLVKSDGMPLLIGDVKQKIDLWLAERGAENPEATIFSIGHDAAVPHSTGNPQQALRLGEPIVFDFFPCEAGGGYFHDFTRTWCLGYAPDDVQAIYDDVLDVFQQLLTEYKANTPFYKYQLRTCELFEQKGHPTICSNPKTQDGFVHGLGHGVGLNIHELPFYRQSDTGKNDLLPGSVIAVEPGLYYPDRNIGVRLENTLWINPKGEFEILAEYPFELVLPMKSA